MAKSLYAVVHHAYCGMTIPLGDGFTYTEARARVKRRIAWFENIYGGEVVWHSNNRVELCEPETCLMIPDACGILLIQKEKDVVIQ